LAAGPDELKQAAKRVREGKRKPQESHAKPDGEALVDTDTASGPMAHADTDSLPALRARVAELTAENQALRRELAAYRQGLSD